MRATSDGINILKETESEVNIVFGHGEGGGVRRELVTHKVHIHYKKSTTVYVLSSELGLFHPLSRQRVCFPPGSANSDDWRKV
jgi:hypothetical protein